GPPSMLGGHAPHGSGGCRPPPPFAAALRCAALRARSRGAPRVRAGRASVSPVPRSTQLQADTPSPAPTPPKCRSERSAPPAWRWNGASTYVPRVASKRVGGDLKSRPWPIQSAFQRLSMRERRRERRLWQPWVARHAWLEPVAQVEQPAQRATRTNGLCTRSWAVVV